MPRTGRVLLPSDPHHVVQRGRNRQDEVERIIGRRIEHRAPGNQSKKPAK
jgi:hypothetical protein